MPNRCKYSAIGEGKRRKQVRVVRDLECTLTFSLLVLRIIVMSGAIKF